MSSRRDPGPAQDYVSWFRENASSMLRQAYQLTRNRQSAEDIAQDAAIKIFKVWDDETTRAKILTVPGYVRAIVRNCSLDHGKVPSRTSRREAELDESRDDRAGAETDHDDLHSSLLRLDGNEHDLIVLRYYDNLTIREAGRQLGLSPSQAYRLHDKALAKLAGLLDEGEA